MTGKKPLRLSMPTVAAWIDELREAFGVDSINASIRNGVGGGNRFHAVENGHEIGCEAMPGSHVVNAADMVLAKPVKGARDDD